MNRLGWLVLGLLVCSLTGCSRGPTREEVLRTMVTRQLVPDMNRLADASHNLTERLRALKPGASLEPARAAWREALAAWERVYAFRMGPIVDNSGLLRARFWPLREAPLRARLNAAPALDEHSVDLLGVDLRGMYALEWMLFGTDSALLADSAIGERWRAGAVAFAANAQRYADDGLDKIRDGALLADKLGEQSQQAVSKLVNQMVANVEILVSNRLGPLLEMESRHDLRPSEVQGARSGSSRDLVLTKLRTSQRMYGEPGALSALVKPVAPQIDERVRARFAAALQRVEAIPGPLEVAVVRDRKPLEEALGALKELELALKVDLASVLRVTMTFTPGRGD